MVSSGPSTSVIVPVYNDPEGLERTVQSLLDQSATDYEVIIVDNGSTDRTSHVAQSFASTENVLHVVENQIQGSYAARNTGIEAASGEIIGFVDADMWVEEDYVRSITQAMRTNDRMYMGCTVEVVGDSTPVARYNTFTEFPIEELIQNSRYAPTCCLVVSSDLFEAVGTFDERLISGGDLEFGRRVANAGYDLVFEPSIVLYHPARDTLRSLIKKYVRVGRGVEQLNEYYPDRFEQNSLLHPFNYLPSRPSTFREDLSTEPESILEFGSWFLTDWAITVSMSVGQIRQRMVPDTRSPEPGTNVSSGP